MLTYNLSLHRPLVVKLAEWFKGKRLEVVREALEVNMKALDQGLRVSMPNISNCPTEPLLLSTLIGTPSSRKRVWSEEETAKEESSTAKETETRDHMELIEETKMREDMETVEAIPQPTRPSSPTSLSSDQKPILFSNSVSPTKITKY